MEVFKRIQPIIEKHMDDVPCAFFMIFVRVKI